ncbi:MAG: hypothetical protein CME06_13940 [Gemmatimonadetes bacterium]|nr:hypothetical protein [Gemmatimonadota bacterium]
MSPSSARLRRELVLLFGTCLVAALAGLTHWKTAVHPRRPALASVRAARINPLDVEPEVRRTVRRNAPDAFVLECDLIEPLRGESYYRFIKSDRRRRWTLRVAKDGELIGGIWELKPLSVDEIPRRGRPPAPEPGTPPLRAWHAARADSSIYMMAGVSPADVLIEWQWEATNRRDR